MSMETSGADESLLRGTSPSEKRGLDGSQGATLRAGSWLRSYLLRLLPVAMIAFIVIIWIVASDLHLVSPLAVPSPAAVWREWHLLVTIGYAGQSFSSDVLLSVMRIGIGFFGALVIGVPVGIFMATNQWIYRTIDPILQFVRPVPPLAYIPLLVVWFGIGESSKVILIILGTIPIIIISTAAGVSQIPDQRIRVAKCLGATRTQILRHVVLPSVLPAIFTGMRVGIGVAWTCLVAAEMIAASAGLGWLIQDAGQELQVSIIFIGIIAIGVLGYAMELVIRALEHVVVPWRSYL